MSAVSLVHVHGGEPGLRRDRERAGGGFVYLDEHGGRVTDPDTLARIHALRIPPRWTDVWIAAGPNAHLQATGLDSKGRRQYLYHPAWRERRDHEKFDDMLAFARRLPEVRRTAARLLDGDGLHRERVLALAIRLLDVGLFRVGWDRYARDNGHVGLTTLRREHVRVGEEEVVFDFVGKAGKRHRRTVHDVPAVRAIAPLKRRRGDPRELLVYYAPRAWRRIHAPDVNNTLRCWAGGPYSAKEFRTWEATVLAAEALAREDADGQRGPRAVNRAVRSVSEALGNTPKVARASYIHPRVIDLYHRGVVIDLPDGAATREAVERRVLDLLTVDDRRSRPTSSFAS